ncbi:MAG: hypothetical protein ABSE67_15140 [Xanthobacteraceae bacterium]
MKRLAIAMGVLAIGLAAAVPARADFAVVKFPDKTCRAWADHRAVPAGAGWKYLWVSVPTWEVAQAKGAYAMKHHWCRAWWK